MKKEVKKFILTFPLAIFTLIVPSFLGNNQILSSLVLFLAGLFMLSIDWRKKNLVFYLVMLIIGPIAEAFAINFGAWTYTNPVFIGVPIWLFFVWGNAGLFVIKLKEFIFSFKS